MEQNEIKKLLPHRDAMLLVDEIELDGEQARGRYTLRGDEWFFRGHFPGNPVAPGVILCEMLAQPACALLAGRIPAGGTPYFTSLDQVRFKSPVKPGDVFESRCRLTRAKPPFYFAQAEGYVGARLCVSASFSFALLPGDETEA